MPVPSSGEAEEEAVPPIAPLDFLNRDEDPLTPYMDMGGTFGQNILMLATKMVPLVLAGETFDWLHENELDDQTFYAVCDELFDPYSLENPDACYITAGTDGFFACTAPPVPCSHCDGQSCSPLVCAALRSSVAAKKF